MGNKVENNLIQNKKTYKQVKNYKICENNNNIYFVSIL